MNNKETYFVAEDYQHTDFGMQRNYTLQEWREQAIEWADMDEHDGLIETLNTIDDNELLDFISEIWQIRFEKGCWQGTPVDNKHGIEFYYEFSTEEEKMYILDSNGKYFDHLLVDLDDKEDKQALINMLENTKFENMCLFFNKTIYNSLEELQEDDEITEDNEYVNIFKVHDKKYYTWSE